VDCGSVVNPNTIEAQVQGAVIFGISAALHGEITLRPAASSKATLTTTRCCASTRRLSSRCTS
jgi:isoquinoline 1-oxidoreductase beta subunit